MGYGPPGKAVWDGVWAMKVWNNSLCFQLCEICFKMCTRHAQNTCLRNLPYPTFFEAFFQQKVLILKVGYPHFFWSHFWKTLAELLPHFHFVHFRSPKCSKKKWGYPTFIWAILSCFREGVRAHIFSWFRVRYHTKVKDAKSTTNFFSFAHARRQFDCTHQEGHTPLSESG